MYVFTHNNYYAHAKQKSKKMWAIHVLITYVYFSSNVKLLATLLFPSVLITTYIVYVIIY